MLPICSFKQLELIWCKWALFAWFQFLSQSWAGICPLSRNEGLVVSGITFVCCYGVISAWSSVLLFLYLYYIQVISISVLFIFHLNTFAPFIPGLRYVTIFWIPGVYGTWQSSYRPLLITAVLIWSAWWKSIFLCLLSPFNCFGRTTHMLHFFDVSVFTSATVLASYLEHVNHNSPPTPITILMSDSCTCKQFTVDVYQQWTLDHVALIKTTRSVWVLKCKNTTQLNLLPYIYCKS